MQILRAPYIVFILKVVKKAEKMLLYWQWNLVWKLNFLCNINNYVIFLWLGRCYQMLLIKEHSEMLEEFRLLKRSTLWSIKRIILFCLMLKPVFILIKPHKIQNRISKTRFEKTQAIKKVTKTIAERLQIYSFI